MEISYCTGLRVTDVLEMKWEQIQIKEGIDVELSKTGVKMTKQLSPRLKAALATAKQLPGLYQQGQKYTRSGFNSTWKRYRAKLPEGHGFQFRDIRKKSITDWQGETKTFSGHKTDQMTARYKIKPIKSPSH